MDPTPERKTSRCHMFACQVRYPAGPESDHLRPPRSSTAGRRAAAVDHLGCLPAGALAQDQSATISGQVTDAQGAAAPGATVTAESPALPAPVTAVTAITGEYTLSLAPGTYAITFQLSGFAPDRQTGIALAAAEARQLDVTLQLAAVAERVDVVGVTPLLGAGIERDRIAADVSVVEGDDLENRGAASLADALHERFGSVTLEGTTTNLFQPTVRFRGFTASPLLGLPQGIAVYQNGVRINEPFGDTVQFDLMPQFAIDQVQLSAGANPTFGLNALGGALSCNSRMASRTRDSWASSPADRSAGPPRPPSTARTTAAGRSMPAPPASRRRAGGSPRPPT